MKVRTTTGGTTVGAKLTALCWGALTLLVPVAVSACSGGSSSSPTVPTFTPSVTTTSVPASGTTPSDGTTTATTTATATPGVASGSAVATHTATATATVTITPTPTQIPTVAPVTGGGGTAGLQDGLLFGVGAAAILAGAGSIAYRRRLTRGR